MYCLIAQKTAFSDWEDLGKYLSETSAIVELHKARKRPRYEDYYMFEVEREIDNYGGRVPVYEFVN